MKTADKVTARNYFVASQVKVRSAQSILAEITKIKEMIQHEIDVKEPIALKAEDSDFFDGATLWNATKEKQRILTAQCEQLQWVVGLL